MQRSVEVEGVKIGYGYPVFMIAEAGVNHNGDLGLAKELIVKAKEAGAQCVKFQTFNTPDIIINNVAKAPYQKETTPAGESQREMLERLQIDETFHGKIIAHCKKNGISFLSTPYDERSLELLVKLNVPAIKVASTDATNLLFLEKVAKIGVPVIMATGMCLMDEVEAAYNTLRDNGCKDLAILKCTSNYPTSIEEVNLRGIATLAEKFDAIVGFSDHTEGVGAAPYAVACGAKIIEKHFTLDKAMEGPDHRASLSPNELKALISEIRKVEKMLGTHKIEPTKSEHETKRSLQKCFVARRDIKKGEKLSRENIIAKRTGGEGISAIAFYDVLGKICTENLGSDEIILAEYLVNGSYR